MNKDTFCVLPFVNIFAKTFGNYEVTPCCNFNSNIIHSEILNYDHLIEIYNNDNFINLRKNLLSGIKDSKCRMCWNLEKNNITSLRQKANNDFSKKIDTTELTNNSIANEYKIQELISLEIFPSKYCNISCRMCGPGASSKWEKILGNNKENTNDHLAVEIFQKAVKTGKLQRLSLTGGETILQKQFADIIDLIEKNDLYMYTKNMTIEFVTNCTVFHDVLFDKICKLFGEVSVTLSIDGINNTIEDQRYGCKWDNVENNAKRYLTHKSKEKISVVLNCVVTALNIEDIASLIHWVFSNGIIDVYFTPVEIDGNILGIDAVDLDKNQLIEKIQKIDIEWYYQLHNFMIPKFEFKKNIESIINIIKTQNYDADLNKKLIAYLQHQDKILNAETR